MQHASVKNGERSKNVRMMQKGRVLGEYWFLVLP
jgi:hypothetical protein